MRHHWLKWLAIGCSILIIIGLSTLGFDLYHLFYRPMPLDNAKPTIIQLAKSTSASSFVHKLEEQHLIKSPSVLLMFIRTQGLSQQLKAGIYQIKPGESAQQFLYRVVAGDVLIETFHIIEGTTQAQIANKLEHAPYLTYHSADWQAVASTFASAEGLLLADTYQYVAGSESRDLLNRAHTNLQQFLDQSWQKRSPDLPYNNAYELLIAASIIEKEAALSQERRLIAGVIVNRLRKHMPLQMDPTVIYALGTQFNGKLTREDLQVDSPYNSYRYRGLPPTPIAMVGKDAIDAAAHPEHTEYMYFVARGDGSHSFSVTYDQQKQAIARYQRKTDGVE